MSHINWKDFIQSDKNFLSDNPFVKGTRLSVEFILELFAKGSSKKEVLENYTSLTQESQITYLAFCRIYSVFECSFH